MALNETQQVTEAISKSHHVLITFKKDFTVDAVASALALYLIFKKQDKLVDIVCSDFVLPENLKFLPQTKNIKDKFSSLQKFVINVDTSKSKIDEFSYDLADDQLKIYITPKSGSFRKENLNTENSEYKYDLIITLDTPDLESLGKIYQNFTEFFYNTTIVNIDHHPENEHFGQINYTNMNAVATTEILFNLINNIDKNLIDSEIATCLMTGLIAKTRSFKTNNVTPKTLEVASQLLSAEADREAIIKSLYRSRNLSTLNLWGRVLARLKSSENNKLVWSLLTENDFVEAGANQEDLPDVIDELISFIPGVEIVILIYQKNGKNYAMVYTLKNHNALYLTSYFNPEGSKQLAKFSLPELSLLEAEKEIIDKIKERLG